MASQQLFLPLVRLEVRIDEYKAGIVRDVGKQRRQLRAVILRQGEQIESSSTWIIVRSAIIGRASRLSERTLHGRILPMSGGGS